MLAQVLVSHWLLNWLKLATNGPQLRSRGHWSVVIANPDYLCRYRYHRIAATDVCEAESVRV